MSHYFQLSRVEEYIIPFQNKIKYTIFNSKFVRDGQDKVAIFNK